ncbi:hypothetical protein pipiens_003220 [Culex pipiens pipiens]|uniref:Uncharacterized protein n=1 Tax=Culex pipiens pipiens TaxID=38569 RepID=A0ABD1D1T1_CULPP
MSRCVNFGIISVFRRQNLLRSKSLLITSKKHSTAVVGSGVATSEMFCRLHAASEKQKHLESEFLFACIRLINSGTKTD